MRRHLLIAAVLAALGMTASTTAWADDIASGTDSTCTWVIDADSMLTISPTDGVSGVLANLSSYYSGGIGSDYDSAPWFSYSSSVKSIVVKKGVKLVQKQLVCFMVCGIAHRWT